MNKVQIAAILLLPLMAGACSVAPVPTERYYRLDVPVAASGAAYAGHVVVESIEAHGIYSERALLFRAPGAASAIERYNYQYWVEPPGLMLRDSLVSYLRGTFGTAQVLAAGSRVRGDLVIRARLKRFEQVLDAPPRAALAIEVTVSDSANSPRFVLDFSEEAPAAGSSIEDYVVAMNGLIAKVSAQLTERLRKEVRM
jgi:ABC-type uncharacterized transport system auxiliary subunit